MSLWQSKAVYQALVFIMFHKIPKSGSYYVKIFGKLSNEGYIKLYSFHFEKEINIFVVC